MQIGAYQVLFELGRGGMGTVYLGRVLGTGDFERLVAIKRQREVSLGFEEPPERFLTEARLAGLIHHANVVGMHQAGFDEDGYYFVCDYVEGLSLAGLVNRNVPHPLWPVAIVARVMLDALAGLQAVHDAVDTDGRPLEMLHRDLAIDNLLVGRDGVTRLADFGIAKTSRSVPMTDADQIRGKLPYLAPEYLRSEPLDKSFDLYAAGVTLWVALRGQLPWGERSEVQMMQSILNEGVPPLSTASHPFAPALDAVVARACHPHRRERFQSAREMLDGLTAAVSSVGTIASHVQVAEYVEKVAGQDLANRRMRIQARRKELESGPLSVPSAPIARPSTPVMVPTVPNRVATVLSVAPPSAVGGALSTMPARGFTRPAPTFTPPGRSFAPANATPPGPRTLQPEPRFTPPLRNFTPPLRSFTPPARSITPTPRSTPIARSTTSRSKAPASGTTSTRSTPATGSATSSVSAPSTRSVAPPARSAAASAPPVVSERAPTALVTGERTRLPLSPALPRLALLAGLALLLLAGYLLVGHT